MAHIPPRLCLAVVDLLLMLANIKKKMKEKFSFLKPKNQYISYD
ncbi:hypothetical protein FEDK69T_04040 [Flavobacterium enshiense DK69]|nr:hypothetical protein FEDK69T_04040 [Flavobacterium enshiense DK69]